MALTDLSELDGYKETPFPPGYPADQRTFYSPVDNVHEALRCLVGSAERSLIIAMYGFDDDELADIVKDKAANGVEVQLTLDSSQAAGAHEKELLQRMNFPVGYLAIGRSEKHAIMHLKMVVIDDLDVVMGSTNWSLDGETKQDNQLTVIRNPLVAAEARVRLEAIHQHMLGGK